MTVAYAIRDRRTGETFRRAVGPTGWYSHDLASARLYQTRDRALHTIAKGEHHVKYPGTRTLEIVPVRMEIIDPAR